MTPGLLAELRAAGVPIDTYFALYDDTFGQGAADIALTRAAAHVLTKRRPSLTALHLLVHRQGAARVRPGTLPVARVAHDGGLLHRAAARGGRETLE